jgi:exodeoxyribonuclease V gamma subunit
MSLALHYVRSLEEIVTPAEAFLRRQQGDLFARPRVVVPTAGAKAWLEAELARRLAASSPARADGVIANVEFVYPGTISRLLEPASTDGRLATENDPWNVERLTFTILEIIAGEKSYATRIERAGGPLLAARAIADRFDHEHFRRPGMILAWEAGRAELSPTADLSGDTIATPLASRDRWQYDLWRKVRLRIGQSSPPARDQLAPGPADAAVLIAGLQSLSLHQIQLLQRLSELPTSDGSPCTVEVVLVHPSPVRRIAWATTAPVPSPGVPPVRREPAPDEQPEPNLDPQHTVDPLVEAWLRGSRESQWLLASQGLLPTHAKDTTPATPTADTPLLARLQHTVAAGSASAAPHEQPPHQPTDHSLLIHRCHDLSRQAEVLHDAILHAFDDLEDLAPHEIVIVSPQIAAFAPHLEATFHRTVKGRGSLLGNHDGEISLPLVVADRGIHEVSSGAELLAAVLELAGSRCSVDALLAVATHPLVLDHLHLDDDAVASWRRCIEQTKIRWGLDAKRRERAGLAMPELSAHSWRLGLERMLLGAVVSEGTPEPVLGTVVPLPHVEAAEVTGLSALVSIFQIIDLLDAATSTPQPIHAWCDLLEETLASLAGEDTPELGIPMQQLDALRKAATHEGSTCSIEVPYHDIKTLLTARLTASAGRQPLLTGGITATSMIPLRSVPFRVVCLAGFDDTAMSAAEQESEDLVARQDLLGDTDPRLEIRRGLLDGLLSASERLVITCTGMDVKNNATLPLVTPLAELVDCAGRHGAETVVRDGESHSSIEIFHPRHACSRRNFTSGGVLTGPDRWSHDTAALAAAEALRREQPTPPLATTSIEPPSIIELEWLAAWMHDPLWPYISKTLDINVWRDDDVEIPATLPLELERRETKLLRDDYLERLLATSDRAGLAAVWSAAVQANGDVPVLGYGGDVIEHIVQFADALLATAADLQTPLDARQAELVHLELGGVTLSGTLDSWYPKTGSLVFVRPDAQSTQSFSFGRVKSQAAAELLAARASGHPVTQAVIFSERDKWQPGQRSAKGALVSPVTTRRVVLDDAIDVDAARQMLAALVTLYRQAAVRPHGLFQDTAGLVATDRHAAAEAFDACLTSRSYASSYEAVVHGLHPDFNEVFPEDDPRLAFFAEFSNLTAIRYRNPKYVYNAPPRSA